ncbi:MAG: HlyD family secretion protein [Flavobacteriales bacterium]
MLKEYDGRRTLNKVLLGICLVIFAILFLPWTQNVRGKGIVTSLNPSQRPQSLQSVIDGRIEKWFVSEGQKVKKGDTILFISEIKDEYFDPKLLERTQDQIKSKEFSVSSYMEKVKSLDKQIDALLTTKELKLMQAKNYQRQAELKVQTDSMDFQAAVTNLDIAQKQYQRMESLHAQGLKSLTDLESRKLKLQETQAKKLSAENKLAASRNELINAEVELNSIENQYQDKISKAESEKFEAMSAIYDAEAIVSKMQTTYMNYSVRKSNYYITAPQNGIVTKAIKTGIGENVKQGEALVTIMPSDIDIAVELFVEPMDLPLISKGNHVRFVFDGWPSVVFSGWPNASYGTYGGEVVAIDNFANAEGKFRLLVVPDKNDIPWPEQLKVGSGAQGIALLNNVFVGYEIWRQLNGFPPEFYKGFQSEKKDQKK